MKKILQKEEKVLRQLAKEVPLTEIDSLKIKKIIREMKASLKSQDDGVAIAAPQIGYSLRIFVVAGKIFGKEFFEQELPLADEPTRLPDGQGVSAKNKNTPKDLVFINPKISKLSRDKEWLPEGCLSVRPFYGKTYRSKKATVTAYDETGKKFERGGSGLLAQIFQHETDHLNGVLFIDHAKDVKAEEMK
jgi:peptide deformylase